MTKKDFTAIASAISEARRSVYTDATSQAEIVAFQSGKDATIAQVIKELSRHSVHGNSNFDAARFAAACMK